VIGVASFPGGESTPSRAVVLSAGHAYRLGTDLLHSEFEHDGALPRLLLCYLEALITQVGQIAACSRHHSLEQRMCRFVLSCLDRLPSTDLTITQETVADMLSVRREGVTEAAGRLQRAGLIDHHRGHIGVIDRARLETRACEWYAVVRCAYDELLGAVKNIGDARVDSGTRGAILRRGTITAMT
jgi:CRP-like cAMP-binding protein